MLVNIKGNHRVVFDETSLLELIREYMGHDVVDEIERLRDDDKSYKPLLDSYLTVLNDLFNIILDMELYLVNSDKITRKEFFKFKTLLKDKVKEVI